MAARPSIQFYFGDWKRNKKLRFCSWAARGVWIEVMGLMHDAEDSGEYGVIRKPLKRISVALGAPMRCMKELVENGVMYGCEKGLCEPMVYRPKHAGVEGDPVVLIEAQQGPIWYSPRMVKDEYVRSQRGQNTRFGDTPKGGIGDTPKGTPNDPPPQREGYGASSSSSSSSSELGSFTASAQDSQGAGTSSALGKTVEVIDGDGNPVPSTIASLTPTQSAVVVLACKGLRKMGAVRFQPGDEGLIALAAEGFTAEQLVRCAAEKSLRDAGLWDDPDVHPELFDLLTNGASQQAMGLTPDQHTAVRSAVSRVSVGYIASTLRGRRRDAENGSPRGAKRRNQHAHPANESFEGKTYVGTPTEQLSPEFRDALEREGLA